MIDSTIELLVAISQIATAIGTVVALFFIASQAWSTKGQLEILKNDFQISKRPWIYRDPDLDNSSQKNYTLLDDTQYNEKYVRVSFINQGRFHSSSITYSHMYITLNGLNELYNKPITDEDLNNVEENELDILKSRVKESKYIVRGPRVIVPGATFGKRFYLTKRPIEHYRQENPDDSKIIEDYENGNKIYLVILIDYRFGKGENCEYGGILTKKI